VRLSSTNGRIRSDFELVGGGQSSNRMLRGRIGGSSREIVLRSTNGSVTLRKHETSGVGDPDEPRAEPSPAAEPSAAPKPSPPARPRPRARPRP
jgi:hypothetical protein